MFLQRPSVALTAAGETATTTLPIFSYWTLPLMSLFYQIKRALLLLGLKSKVPDSSRIIRLFAYSLTLFAVHFRPGRQRNVEACSLAFMVDHPFGTRYGKLGISVGHFARHHRKSDNAW